MKKLFLACALLGSIGLGSVGAYAQEHDHQMPNPDARATQLQKMLQLSDEQTGKVKKVFESDAQQRKAVFDKYKPQFEAFHADMKKQHEQTHEQLKAVLTPKQQQALEAMHEKHGMMGKMHGEQCPMHDSDEHEQAPHK